MLARAAGFLVGVIAALQFAAQPLAWCAALAGAGLCGWRWPPARGPLVFLLSGVALCSWHVGRALERRVSTPLHIAAVGCVAGPVRVVGSSLRFEVELHAGAAGVGARRVRLVWYHAAQVPVPGECWYWSLRLLPPRGLVNFHGSDAERRHFAARIDARGHVRGPATARRLTAAGWRAALLRARLALAHRTRFLLGEHAHGGIPLALSVGLRDGLSPQHWQTFAATGTGHLMAISGLHVGLLAALGFAAGRWLPSGRRGCGLTRAWLSALVCAAAYAALAGFALPTRRALIMLAVFAGAALTRRRYAAGDVLALGLVLVLVLDPFAVLGPGLWLSFGAVGALLIGRGPGRARPVVLQAAVFVGLAPLVAAWSGALSLLSPLANLVCIPLFSVVIIPVTLLATLLSPFSQAFAAGAFAAVLQVLAHVVGWLDALASVPWALQPLPARPLWGVALALCGVLMLPLRMSSARVLALALCLPLLAGRHPRLGEGAWRLTAFDVGQGMAVLIETRDHTLLYDTGNAWRVTDAGAAVLVPQLRALGRHRLDTLVVSHADQDHAGGVASVLAELPARRVFVGEPLPAVAHQPQACRRGVAWHRNGVRFAFVHPEPGDEWRGNDASCVLQVQGPACSALLTGDIEALAEVSLLWSDVPLAADVVAGQHHGSRTSSSRAFVAATGPAYVVFATGYANRWQFPNRRIVQRWRSAGTTALDTAHSGALTLTCAPRRGLSPPRGARTERPGPWRVP